MRKEKHHYIKYSFSELESYTEDPETCVRKVRTIEPIRFSPTIFGNFKSCIEGILSKKIGKYDSNLDGVVLDFRNTKILNSTSGIRSDSAYSAINVETSFYVFAPRKGATVTGVVKYINRMSMETIISVVIYRVFNVKVTVKGIVKQDLEKNEKIQIRVKDFHFENAIPFIEGEVLNNSLILRGSSKKLFEETLDSGISESSLTSEANKEKACTSSFKIKKEREFSVERHLQQKPAKSKKRKLSSESAITPISKKIKSEPPSPTRAEPETTPLRTTSKKDKKHSLDFSMNGSIEYRSISSTPFATKDKQKKKKSKHLDDDELRQLLSEAKVKAEI